MLALLYLTMCLGLGYVICDIAFPRLPGFGRTTYGGTHTVIPSLFVCLPAWSLFGTLPFVWATYGMGYAFRSHRYPLYYANLILIPLAAVIIMGYMILKLVRARRKEKLEQQAAQDMPIAPEMKLMPELEQGTGLFELIFMVLVAGFFLLLFFWTFNYHGGKYYVGWSVASDFSPHIGMIRSFAVGNNFPTSYSHFAGADIKYHFLFQFLVGNLNYLGMRLDWAFNLPSAWFLLCTFLLLYFYAMKLTGKRAVAVVTTVLFTFRSSYAFLFYAGSISKEDNVLKVLRTNTEFIGSTEHEDWGLWNLNVYLNQRHFAIGLCVLLFVLIYFTQFLYGAAKRTKQKADERLLAFLAENPTEELLPGEKAEYIIRESVFRKEGWISNNWGKAAACGILLGLCSFFNGACVIACLCVLFIMAWFSDRRLEFAVAASLAVILSSVSTSLFIDGNVVSPKYFFGFLAEQKTFFGVVKYIVLLCGLLPAVVLAAQVFLSGAGKLLSLAFTAPIILAFTVSLTKDIAVNHKYVMIGLMLLCIPAASLIIKLWQQKGIYVKFLTVLLLCCLTVTGLYECGIILRRNDMKLGGMAEIDENSDLCQWVMHNTDSKDVFLTDWYSLNEYVLGGAMLYYGWPYYAWSAGYDTDGREVIVREMYETDSPERLDELVSECGIRYIVIDNEVYWGDQELVVNFKNISSTYGLVYNDGFTMIFDTKQKLGVMKESGK